MLFEEYYYYPIVTCIEGSDGKKDHTVTIYKGQIFDGNFRNVLFVSREALDLCCSEDTKPCKFSRFHMSFIFENFEDYWFHNNDGDKKENKKLKQKKKNAKRKQRGDKRQKHAEKKMAYKSKKFKV